MFAAIKVFFISNDDELLVLLVSFQRVKCKMGSKFVYPGRTLKSCRTPTMHPITCVLGSDCLTKLSENKEVTNCTERELRESWKLNACRHCEWLNDKYYLKV